MAAAHESEPTCSRRFFLLGVGFAVVPLGACRPASRAMIPVAGRARADALAHAWAAHEGAPDRNLGPDNDLTLGESGFFYQASEDALYGRVWVTMARTEDAPPERLQTYRRILAALNDPKIGGMYERGGGHFVLDEQRQGFFLVRRFDVPRTAPDELVRVMERLQTVAAKWTVKWYLDVAMIMHGKEKAPERPVLLDP